MTLRNTSASQVSAWDRCQRYWHYGWVKKIKSPPSLAMQRGTYIHEGIEYALKNEGRTLDNDYTPYVESAKPFLPIGEEKLLIEKKIVLPTGPGVPPWIGYIDLVDDTRVFSETIRVMDYKSTSDFRYAKTPKELSENSQLISYARFLYEKGFKGPVELAHLYLKTAKKTPKKPKPKLVTVVVEQEQVEKIWTRDIGKVVEMVEAAKIENTDLLPPTTSSCGMYGGCPHRSRCGLMQKSNLFGNQNGNGEIAMDFLRKLREAKEKGNGNGVPEGVVPPDAPERTTPVVETAAAAAPPPETPVTAEASAPAEEPPKKRGRPKGATSTKVKKNGAGFILYIDCIPTKDNTDVEPTLFEDWIEPIVVSLNETASSAKNLAHYQLLPYGEEKSMFSMAVVDSLSRLPSKMIVNSNSPGARDALGVLIPHATTVVQRLR